MEYSTSPGIDTMQMGPTAFSVTSKRHWQSGVNGIAKVPKRSGTSRIRTKALGCWTALKPVSHCTPPLYHLRSVCAEVKVVLLPATISCTWPGQNMYVKGMLYILIVKPNPLDLQLQSADLLSDVCWGCADMT